MYHWDDRDQPDQVRADRVRPGMLLVTKRSSESSAGRLGAGKVLFESLEDLGIV